MIRFETHHSKTVYSLVWPQTEQVMRACLGDVENMLARHRAPHRQAQDAIGPDFAQQWWDWADLGACSAQEWSEFYPTAGASEALREIINELASKKGSLVVFEGEYEGYEAIATGQNIPVIKIPRERWQEVWGELASQHPEPLQWWVSQPSALNGCWWGGLEDWMEQMRQHSNVEVWLDATYVGATPTVLHRPISLATPAYCAGVVFSLSKPAGMYYRRAGGCFARRRVPGLWGNKWFKNIDSICLAQAWLSQIPRGSLPDLYRPLQEKVLSIWNEQSSSPWLASDVILLAHNPSRPSTETCERYRRGPGYRVCVTPSLHELIYDPA